MNADASISTGPSIIALVTSVALGFAFKDQRDRSRAECACPMSIDNVL